MDEQMQNDDKRSHGQKIHLQSKRLDNNPKQKVVLNQGSGKKIRQSRKEENILAPSHNIGPVNPAMKKIRYQNNQPIVENIMSLFI